MGKDFYINHLRISRNSLPFDVILHLELNNHTLCGSINMIGQGRPLHVLQVEDHRSTEAAREKIEGRRYG